MLWLAAMALTPPAPPPPDCSAGVLGDYNCDGCVDLEDRTRRISCMWGDFLTEGCCNGAETPWPGGLSDYTRISSYCLEELELPQVCEGARGGARGGAGGGTRGFEYRGVLLRYGCVKSVG